MRYAQIDETNTVIGISTLSGAVNAPNMITINDNPHVTFGWRWADGAWQEPALIPEPLPTIPSVSNEEVIQSIEDLKIELIIAGVIHDV